MSEHNEVSIVEVQQLIGRNLITFQSIEIILLDIHLQKGGKGTEQELAKKRKKLMKMSFGDLINTKAVHKLDSNIDLENMNIDIETTVLNFTFLGDDEYFNQLLKKLRQYSTARNNLVHKFQLNFNLNDKQSRAEAKNLLNQQFIALEPLKEELREISKGLTIRRKHFLEFLNSDEFFEKFEEEVAKEY